MPALQVVICTNRLLVHAPVSWGEYFTLNPLSSDVLDKSPQLLIEELKEKVAHTRLYGSNLNSATYSAGDAWRAVHLCGPTVF